MTGAGQRVAIITGGSQGIGAGLVAAYRRRDWGGRRQLPHDQALRGRAVLTISGDISEPATTDRIIGEALDRFGRIETLINNAGIFIAKPFTDYTAAVAAFPCWPQSSAEGSTDVRRVTPSYRQW